MELLDTLRAGGASYSDDLDDVTRLSPFAAAFRYDALPEEAEEPFDAGWALACVRRTRVWAEKIVRAETDASESQRPAEQ